MLKVALRLRKTVELATKEPGERGRSALEVRCAGLVTLFSLLTETEQPKAGDYPK